MKYILLALAILSSFATAHGANIIGPGGLPPGPQCFPYVYTYRIFMDTFSMQEAYDNQAICRKYRLEKFGY